MVLRNWSILPKATQFDTVVCSTPLSSSYRFIINIGTEQKHLWGGGKFCLRHQLFIKFSKFRI